MDERKDFFKVLSGDTAERLPWFADLSYLYSAKMEEESFRRTYGGDEGYLRFYREMGAGIYLYAPDLWKKSFCAGVSYREENRDKVRHEYYETPAGILHSKWHYMPETHAYACTEHFVKSIEDARMMAYVYENTVWQENFEPFLKMDTLWGADGFAMAIAPISVSPLQSLLARWAGVEMTVELLCDEEEELCSLMHRMHRSLDKPFEILCKSPAPVVEFAENLSSEVTGRRFFEDFNLPWYQERTRQLHSVKKKVGIHIDGTLSPCFELLPKCGFDFAEAVTPRPVGDLEPEELRKRAGNDMIIFGGLPGALFSPLYSEAEFEGYLQRVTTLFRRGKGFVLGVADQVPPDGLLSRVKRVRQVVNNLK